MRIVCLPTVMAVLVVISVVRPVPADEIAKALQPAADEVAVAKPGEGAVAKPVEVEVWAIASRSAGDDATASEATRRRSAPPDFDSRDDLDTWIQGLIEQKRLLALQHFRLGAVSGHPATAKIGANMPRVVATALSEYGRMNTIHAQSIGTLLQVTPRLEPGETIYLKLSFEISELRKSADVSIQEPIEGDRLAADVVDELRFESTLRVNNGDVAVAYQTSMGNSSSGESYLILVSARSAPDRQGANGD